MKKLFAILVAVMFAFSATYAVDPLSNPVSPVDYSGTYLSESGAGTQDAVEGVDDLSYDESEGQYCIYVICPLELTPTTTNNKNLGYINPDGSRGLSNEYMTWTVNGGDGWFFEAWLKNDQFAHNGDGQTDYVYFVNPYWGYQMDGGTEVFYSDGDEGDYDMEYHIEQLQLSGVVTCDNCGTSAADCAGLGTFKFYPNQVVATELAEEDTYYWDVFIGVDYLTWTVPLDPNGDPYTQPTGPTP